MKADNISANNFNYKLAVYYIMSSYKITALAVVLGVMLIFSVLPKAMASSLVDELLNLIKRYKNTYDMGDFQKRLEFLKNQQKQYKSELEKTRAKWLNAKNALSIAKEMGSKKVIEKAKRDLEKTQKELGKVTKKVKQIERDIEDVSQSICKKFVANNGLRFC